MSWALYGVSLRACCYFTFKCLLRSITHNNKGKCDLRKEVYFYFPWYMTSCRRHGTLLEVTDNLALTCKKTEKAEYLNKVVFYDEATIHMSGIINRRDCKVQDCIPSTEHLSSVVTAANHIKYVWCLVLSFLEPNFNDKQE